MAKPILDAYLDPTLLTFHLATCRQQPNTTHLMHQYLLDFRNESAQQWLLDDLKGLVNGSDGEAADGIWLDDTHAFNEHHDEELGYTAAAVAAIDSGLQHAAQTAQQQLAAAGKWVYHYENNNVLLPVISRDSSQCMHALLQGNASSHLFSTMYAPGDFSTVSSSISYLSWQADTAVLARGADWSRSNNST